MSYQDFEYEVYRLNDEVSRLEDELYDKESELQECKNKISELEYELSELEEDHRGLRNRFDHIISLLIDMIYDNDGLGKYLRNNFKFDEVCDIVDIYAEDPDYYEHNLAVAAVLYLQKRIFDRKTTDDPKLYEKLYRLACELAAKYAPRDEIERKTLEVMREYTKVTV